MKSLYNLSALRKIDLNEDKLELECLISNLKIKGNLGFDNEDIYKTKYLDYFIPELKKRSSYCINDLIFEFTLHVPF